METFAEKLVASLFVFGTFLFCFRSFIGPFKTNKKRSGTNETKNVRANVRTPKPRTHQSIVNPKIVLESREISNEEWKGKNTIDLAGITDRGEPEKGTYISFNVNRKV